MANPGLLLRRLLLSLRGTADQGAARLSPSTFYPHLSHYSTSTATASSETISHDENQAENSDTKWFNLPPYTATSDGAVLRKEIAGLKNDDVKLRRASKSTAASASRTALKWAVRCCPELPRSLVQKLFRLRQVRRKSSNMEDCNVGAQLGKPRLKRVSAKEFMNLGDKIFLPITVKQVPV